jgi:hypothetical protein
VLDEALSNHAAGADDDVDDALRDARLACDPLELQRR